MTTGTAIIQQAAVAPDEWLSRKEAARYLSLIGPSVTPRTLEKLANNNNEGKGPAFTRFGWRTVRYLRKDLDAWDRARRRRVE